MQTKRESWIDIFKVLLIFLVVVGHCHPDKFLLRLIYGFHIPAFFIISGYLYKPSSWIKTTKSLFIPVLVLSFINLLFVLYCCKDTFTLPDNFIVKILEPFLLFKSENGAICLFVGFWFILCLYLCRMLFGDMKHLDFFRKHYGIICSICIIIMIFHDILPDWILNSELHNLYFIRTIACFPFFCFGYWYRKYHDKIILRTSIVVGLLIIYIILCFWNGAFDIYGDNYGKNYVISFIIAIIGFLSIQHFLKKMNLKNSLSFVIEVLSKGTLVILGLHILIRNILWNKNIISRESNIGAFVIGIVVLAICYYPIKFVLRKYPVLIGKR